MGCGKVNNTVKVNTNKNSKNQTMSPHRIMFLSMFTNRDDVLRIIKNNK